MGFMDMFSTRQAPAPAPVAAPAPQAPTQQQGMQGPGTQPGQPQQNASGQDQQNVLAPFTKLWENPAEGGTGAAPKFQLDPKILGEVAGSVPFMDGISPEIMQRVQSGDSNAIVEMVQAVAQNVYKNTLQHNATLTDTFVGAYSKHNNQNLAPQVKSQLVAQELAKIPNYGNPAVKPMLDNLAKQVQQQNPEASPAEVAKMTTDYLNAAMSSMGFAGNSEQSKAPTAGEASAPDWTKWLNTGKAI